MTEFKQIKKALQVECGSLTDLPRRWNSAEEKQAALDELADHGVPLTVLQQVVPNGTEVHAFDLVAHITFDQKPLTRRERVTKVKKRDMFSKYNQQARTVLEALLVKFADHGVQNIEDAKVLDRLPFPQFGSKEQIRRGIFGGIEEFTEAVRALERALYEEAEKKQA